MARGVYTIPMENVTVITGATTVFVNPGVDATIEILRCWLSQAANATSAQELVRLNTQVTAFPTLTSVSPIRTVLLDAVSTIVGGTAGAAGTSGVDASAEGAGAKVNIIEEGFNVLNGYLWVPQPDETIIMSASLASGFGIGFDTGSPTTLTNWNSGIVFREL